MRYSKPEVVNLGSALASICGGKADPAAQDGGDRHKTANAYEADE